MFRGTTPTLILSFEDATVFSGAEKIVVTFATDYKKVLFEKTENDFTINENTIEIDLTQEETLYFNEGNIQVQVNILYQNGKRATSTIGKMNWQTGLKNEVMT